MRILRTIIALMLLTVAAGSATAQTLKAQKVYMFGFSLSFNDSTVYLTHIQEVPNCYVNEKTAHTRQPVAHLHHILVY